MTKNAFNDGYDISRFVISTTVTNREGEYSCKGRIIQSRGMLQDNGEVEWEDKTVSAGVVGDDPIRAESLTLEQLFGFLAEREFYLFEEETDGSKDDIQEI